MASKFAILTPNVGDVTDFFKNPKAHIETKYPNANSSQILFLIFSSLALFVWEIVILATVCIDRLGEGGWDPSILTWNDIDRSPAPLPSSL